MTAAQDDDLFRTLGTFVVPQLLYVAARLRIADHLAAERLDLQALAARVGAHAPSLERVLLALASVGVFARGRDGRYRLTPGAQPLRSDHPRSRRADALIAGAQQIRAWSEVMHSVTTGGAAFDRAFGESMQAHLARDPECLAAAEEIRARRGERRDAAILDALDLGGARSVVDVGGGGGELLARLLRRAPTLQATLVEAPHAARSAREKLGAAGLAARCEVLEADAREALPAGRDFYLLVEVLHWYDDDDATRILARCRGPRVVVAERVLPPLGQVSADRLADVHMLVMHGGRERTRREFAALFAAAGLRLRRVVPTRAWVSLLVATPARATSRR